MHVWEKRNIHTWFILETAVGKRPLYRCGVRLVGNIQLGLKINRMKRFRLDLFGSGYGKLAGSCEHGYTFRTFTLPKERSPQSVI